MHNEMRRKDGKCRDVSGVVFLAWRGSVFAWSEDMMGPMVKRWRTVLHCNEVRSSLV